ncbi:MAG: HNH endonuclease [Trichodesmium sp. MAG_R03]|nr:HNH endonuclease [Trichodesmium sp. MAG_R03]
MKVDHIKPRSEGGENTYKNKQVLHPKADKWMNRKVIKLS